MPPRRGTWCAHPDLVLHDEYLETVTYYCRFGGVVDVEHPWRPDEVQRAGVFVVACADCAAQWTFRDSDVRRGLLPPEFARRFRPLLVAWGLFPDDEAGAGA